MPVTIRKIIDKILIDGLVIQIVLFLFGVSFLFLSCGLIAFALPDLMQDKNINILLIGFIILLIFGCLFLGGMWVLASLFPPCSKWAKYGLKTPPDGAEIILLLIVPVFFLIAAIFAYFLRLFGLKGYPIKEYKNLYSSK